MKKKWKFGLVFVAFASYMSLKDVSAIEVYNDSENTLNLGGTMQMLGVLELLEDTLNTSVKDELRMYLFQKQARLSVSGRYNNCDYAVKLMFGGEEVPLSNSVMSLLDYYVDMPVGSAYLKAGQFKIPYSRERLTDPEFLSNVDRSIQNNAFNFGRDVGLALHGNIGNATGALGLFTGGGSNVPQRYLPEVLGIPLMVARVGVNKGIDKDVFTPCETGNDGRETKYAAYVNALYSKDSRVGHGTALSIKYIDESYFLNASWNPYMSSSLQAELWQVGIDCASEMPIGDTLVLSSLLELNYGRYSNTSGELSLAGGMVKESLIAGKYELGLRYAAILPDENLGYLSAGTVYPIVNSDLIHEVTPSLVIHVNKGIRIVIDAPIGLNSPVAIEKDNGAYDLMKQPAQVSYSVPGKGIIERQTTYTGRMILQYVF